MATRTRARREHARAPQHVAARPADRVVVSWIAAVLVVVFALQCTASMRRQSATFYEPVYIAAGYSYLQTGDFRLKQDSPPLVPTLSGLALAVGTQLGNAVWFDPSSPLWSGRTEYRFADQFFAR